MAAISDLRAGIAANLATINGLRVSDVIPDNPNPPQAVVSFNDAEYDLDFNRGMSQYNFTIQVIVGRAAERSAQRSLDAYCSSTGTSSIKLAVESNRTLSGVAYDTRVSQLSSYGSITVGDTTYLAAEFDVQCYAS
jgi:hypothetical protein